MSTETATQTQAAPATTSVQTAAQQAAATHPANRGDTGLKVPLGELIKTEMAKATEIEKQNTAPKETKTEAKVETKTEVKAETTEKKTKTSLFDRKEKTEEKTEAKAEDFSGPEDKMELPESADATKKSQFTELKTITKQLRRELAQKVADYETQLKTMKTAQPAETADIQAVRDRLKNAEDRLAIVDLQNHPDFAKQYVEPKNKAITEAKMLLSDNGAEADVAALLTLPRPEFAKKVSELASKMQDFDKASFTTAMREAFRLQADSAQALTKASELATQLQSKSALQQKQAFEDVWGKLGTTGEFLITLEAPDGASPEEKQAIAAYNQEVHGVRANAEKYAFGRLDEHQAASLASKAATLDFLISQGIPRMEKEYSSLRELNAQLASELKGIKGAKETGSVSGDTRAKEGKPGGTLDGLIAQAYAKK